MSPAAPPYTGQTVALLTQHGKERVVAPVLESALGCRVQRVDGFDTDLLGTFTRETARTGTQLEAARRKATKGMELSGLPLGLASEGSFAPDPFTGFMTWNLELLLWVDAVRGIEVVGMAQGAAHADELLCSRWEDLQAFAARMQFPSHLLVLRPQGQDDARLRKGLTDWDALRAAFAACQAEADNGMVFAESDLRAFANPSRMQRIGQAAEDLARRLQSACPACQSPGYWVSKRRAGLPCADCGRPTGSYLSEVWSCVRCDHTHEQRRTDRQSAEPRHCTHCNP